MVQTGADGQNITGGQGVQTPPRKSQVAIDFLKNSGTDPSRRGPIASRGRSVRPSVKYADD